MKRRRVVVCGATGFIGRHMAERFAAEPDAFEVIAIRHHRPAFDHPSITWRDADLCDKGQAEAALRGADIVVQAAATTSGSRDVVIMPYIHIADNAVMNSHLLRAAFDHKVKHFIFFSCSIMYPSSDGPLKESDFDPGRAIEPRYFGAAWTKLYIERMCEFYAGISSVRFTVVRHSNIYGPYDKFDLERSHVFGATIAKAMTARDGRIVVWGPGTERRDFLHVTDLVEFVRTAIDRQQRQYGLYNVGCAEAISVRELVEAIVAASGRTLRIEHDLGKPTIQTSVALDAGRARAELGWEPKVRLADGIRHTLDWYRSFYGERGAAAVETATGTSA